MYAYIKSLFSQFTLKESQHWKMTQFSTLLGLQIHIRACSTRKICTWQYTCLCVATTIFIWFQHYGFNNLFRYILSIHKTFGNCIRSKDSISEERIIACNRKKTKVNNRRNSWGETGKEVIGLHRWVLI